MKRHGLAPRHLTLSAAAFVAVLAGSSSLTACGGDGGTVLPDCSTPLVQVTYPGMRATLSDLATAGQTANAVAGQQADYGAPSLAGLNGDIPAVCIASPTWSAAGLPPGLGIDAQTGQITGAPTQGGLFVAQLTIAPTSGAHPGFVSDSIAFVIRDPATAVINGWDDGRAMPVAGGWLSTQGGALVEVSTGATTMQVSRSVDGGATWTLDAPAAAPPIGGYDTVTDDSGQLYLAGGGAYPNYLADVWRYDGTTWQQQTTQAPFLTPTGTPVAMYASAGSLFAASEDTQGVWRSQDSGQTWPLVSSSAFPGEGGPSTSSHPVCAGVLAGRQVVVTSYPVYGTGQSSPANVWQSDDGGVTWSQHAMPASGPFTTLGGPEMCFFALGRLFIEGQGYYTVNESTLIASSDLDHWDYQSVPPALTQYGNGVIELDGVVYRGVDDKVHTALP